MEPNTIKFVQKIRECTQWAHKKAEVFQAKEAQCHKCNYDKQGRAVALEVGDTVLVCVATFKGHHKMQDQWENREYVVEKWPYPNVPVYVVHTRDGEGCSWILHRNYLLPISPNLEQSKMDKEWQELGMTPHWLQCHLWVMHMLKQNCLGWLPQAQQVAPQKIVQIDLLPFDVALGPQGTNFL